jgi:hypothetical protein
MLSTRPAPAYVPHEVAEAHLLGFPLFPLGFNSGTIVIRPDPEPAQSRCLRRCDFLQAHPADVAFFVNKFPILVRLRGFEFHRFGADGALWQSQSLNESQEPWR